MSDMMVVDAAEERRLTALLGYEVLDSPPESDFDDIVRLAAQLCRAPMAAVSLVDGDRQWLKARIGLDVCETAREHSFCAHAMLGDEVMQVPDARRDARFRDNPAVTGEQGVVFYAGAPLITAAGERLGTLCVVDRVPRLLTAAECHGLRTLARHVMAQLELRQYARGLDAVKERLRDADRLKDEFLARVTHELRTPLTSINGYLEMLDDPGVQSGVGTTDFLHRIRRNSDRLMALIDDILLAAQAGHSALSLQKRVVDLGDLARAAAVRNGVLADSRGLTLVAEAPEPVLAEADERRLAQAVERLVLNAVKFTPHGRITVRAERRGADSVLEVIDTGIGMSDEDRDRVLEPFRRAASAERAEVQGAGLGLSIVKAIVDSHGGTLAIDSAPGQGVRVTLTLPRYAA